MEPEGNLVSLGILLCGSSKWHMVDERCTQEGMALLKEWLLIIRLGLEGLERWPLRALMALPEILSSISSNFLGAHNHLKWDWMPSSGVSEESDSALAYTK